MSGAALHAFIERHRGAAERVYAVVDSARDPQLAFAGIERFGLERWSLFPSNTARQMAAVAPYLIPVPFEPRYPFATPGYFDLWAARLGTSAGILVTTAADTRDVWDHLRGQFLVADERHRVLLPVLRSPGAPEHPPDLHPRTGEPVFRPGSHHDRGG